MSNKQLLQLPPTVTLLLRRLLAATYDLLLIIAIWFLAALIAVICNHGQAISADNIFFKIYLISIAVLFITFFWWRNGQTLGGKSWHIAVVTGAGAPLSAKQALSRCLLAILTTACAGIGWWWMIVDKQNRTLFDRLTHTMVHRCA